jgi:hypothetical protein
VGELEQRLMSEATEGRDRGAKFSIERSASAFNHTVGILRQILEIGVEAALRQPVAVHPVLVPRLRPSTRCMKSPIGGIPDTTHQVFSLGLFGFSVLPTLKTILLNIGKKF